ncbi:Uncharacterized protein SCF082_LOCUS22053 [Durusdinium trenchii]|uniref:Secreted protein n=1 Tax=Durusdinium trenchii TaxID=1381693 RepID=A0ABP0LDH9_9DINO
MWSYLGKSAIFLGGCCSGAAAATFWRSEERRQQIKSGEYYQLKGSYYQVLGHAWDHFRRDFCVVYRPLYHCEARDGRFEAHLLATSHFERFDEFKKVSFDEMDLAAQSCALPGPFFHDQYWGLPPRTAPVSSAQEAKDVQKSVLADLTSTKTPTTSGYGTRSHQEHAIKPQL